MPMTPSRSPRGYSEMYGSGRSSFEVDRGRFTEAEWLAEASAEEGSTPLVRTAT